MNSMENSDIFDLKKLRLNWTLEKLQEKPSPPSEKQSCSSQLIREFKDSLSREFGTKSHIFTLFIENLEAKLKTGEKKEVLTILNSIGDLLDATIQSH
jgi:hypothetical protein